MSSVTTYAHVLAFVLLVVFLSYVTAIIVPFVRRARLTPGHADDFDWHAFIPCLNEQVVIEETLRRFLCDFPTAHVWVIDDDSDDDTVAVVESLMATEDRVHLVRRARPHAREGKGPALNTGYAALARHVASRGDDPDRVIVVVVDADGQLLPGALDLMSAPDVFGDPRVGAAQASVAMNNTGVDVHTTGGPFRRRARNLWSRWLLRCQDIEFRTTIAAMQTLRLRTYSAGMGGNGQFTRLSALHAIADRYGEPWHGALLEDYELGIHTILSGYETRYLHDAVVRQQALPSMRAYLRQRTRWSQGGMQCSRYIAEIFRSPRFSNSAALETTYFLLIPWLGLVGVVLWPTVLLSMVTTGLQTSGSFVDWAVAVWWIWPLTFATGIVPFFAWAFVYRRFDDPEASIARTVYRGFGYWLYTYATYPVLLRAFVRVVRRRNGWDKTRRVVEPAPAASPDTLVPVPALERTP